MVFLYETKRHYFLLMYRIVYIILLFSYFSCTTESTNRLSLYQTQIVTLYCYERHPFLFLKNGENFDYEKRNIFIVLSQIYHHLTSNPMSVRHCSTQANAMIFLVSNSRVVFGQFKITQNLEQLTSNTKGVLEVKIVVGLAPKFTSKVFEYCKTPYHPSLIST